MSTSIGREEAHPLMATETARARRANGPGGGRKVPEDPEVRSMRGVVWSVTLARAVLVPVFLVGALRLQDLASRGIDPGPLRAGLLLALAAIAFSDLLDGFLARRFGLATQAGAIADAVADKLAQMSLVAFFTFVEGPAFASLPLWFFILVVARDAALGLGWIALRSRAVPFQLVHRVHGRAATAAVFTVLFWITAGIRSDALAALLLLTAALIWVSVAGYGATAWMAWRRPEASPSTLRTHGGLR